MTRQFNKIFMLKLSNKNSCIKFDAFSRGNGSLIFPPKEDVQKKKCWSKINFYFQLSIALKITCLFYYDLFMWRTWQDDWSYHKVIWKDMDADGDLDALTARFHVPNIGKNHQILVRIYSNLWGNFSNIRKNIHYIGKNIPILDKYIPILDKNISM